METSISELYDLYRAHPHVSTDTRRIEPGSIFFALRGANFDGNRFVGEALEKGAVAAVCDDPAALEDPRVRLVGDPLTALQELAREHRRAPGDPDPRHLGKQRQNHNQGVGEPCPLGPLYGLRHAGQPEQPHRRTADAARHGPRYGVRDRGDGGRAPAARSHGWRRSPNPTTDC